MANQFGPLLREFRQRAGLTQEALAERSGLGVRTVRGLETGERDDPRMRTVESLAEALDLTAHDRIELLAAAGSQPPADSPRRVPAGADRLTEAASLLAYELRTRLRREEEQRQIHDPIPLPVRWRAAPDGLLDSWTNIGMAKPGETVRPVELAGSLDEIVRVYQRIPSGRLVVLGRAGSGKTILTMRFVLGLLDVSAPGDPVPVIFSVGSWHPGTTALRDWLIEQLLRDHPGLDAPGPGGSTLAAALVESGRILPVLDGFDEIAAGLHRAALAALNATTLPLLVTSRVDEYQAAVESTDVLTAAAAVVLTDLTADDLASYLPRTTRRQGAAGTVWEPVLAHVRDHPDGDLAAVLTTPLMVSLARTIYSDTPEHDPAQLLETGRFGTREAIERHLLGSFVPTVYRREPGRYTHDEDRVEHWLGFLAHHLDRLRTHDLAWWQLGDRMPGWLRMVVSGLVLGIAVGLPAALVIGLIHTVGVGTASAGLGGGLSAALAAGPMEALAVGMTVGLAHGASLAFRSTVFEPSRVRLRLRVARRSPVLRRFAVGLAVGVGLGIGLGIARELGATFWIVGRIGDTTAVVVLFGLVFGVVWGLVWGVMANFEAPVDISSAGSPVDLLNTNRRTVVVQSLALGLMTWLTYTAMVAVLHGPRFGLAYGLSYGLVLGLAISLGASSLTAWGTWMVFARVWLPVNGRLPWTLPEFLEDAYRRGVLRRAGAVYQFRHARLQDHLKQAYRTGR
ncbi:NACHT domain-containing protein [Actinophytocola glycyrrhizae]|uniref:NACHT domain-containing protein n=1 Tax=Actinophytocola glycyrrhizae TaxID=2044873 RepID=A0ABV9RX77_9PSEU